MAKIPVGHAKPGMIVSSAVTDRHGRLLIPEGTELSEKHVGALGMWGVPFIEIEGAEAESELESIPPEAIEAAKAQIEDDFALTDRDHPLIAGLFDIALARRAKVHAKAMTNGGSHG